MVQHEFGLYVNIDNQAETSVVLNYNGSDLKPTWPLADLKVPPGAIMRCLHREKKTANLYVHCGFNNQILELFDDTITTEITIGEIRKKISDRIGIPLSTFCLETHDCQRRFYDQMKLFDYDLKLHDHIYLKVWGDYENFLNSCMKGFPKRYSHDDLTRHYQLQIALYIAAFYGFMELAHSALQLGARSDRPVGEHPSRQWSSETTVQDIPEMLKCPIHIAVERGQMKMVDLFVRQSILCTQIVHPISGFLPYRMALSMSVSTKSKAEKQSYRYIYLYLYDKQFNLKIPLNANSGSVSSSLISNTNVTSLNQPSLAPQAFFSLPRYCKIIRWYERAQERVWKKYGVHIDDSIEIKRAHQSKGVLGYKVMIDGFNNAFNASTASISAVASDEKSKIEQTGHYGGYTDEEREKIRKMKTYMKWIAANERRRAKSTTDMKLKTPRHAPLLAQHGLFGAKIQAIDLTLPSPSLPLKDIDLTSERSNSQGSLGFIDLNDVLSLESTHDRHGHNQRVKPTLKTICKTVVSKQIPRHVSFVEEKKEHEQQENCTLPPISTSTSNGSTVQSTWKQKVKMMVTTKVTSNRQEEKSSVDTYVLSSSHITEKNHQKQKIAARVERSTQIEKSTTRSPSGRANRSIISDSDFRIDRGIQQSTLKSFERCASASIHATAVSCLQEAEFFKRKSWIKQVEISKEMVKQRAKRLFRPADDGKINSVLSPMRVISATPSLRTNRVPTGKAN